MQQSFYKMHGVPVLFGSPFELSRYFFFFWVVISWNNFGEQHTRHNVELWIFDFSRLHEKKKEVMISTCLSDTLVTVTFTLSWNRRVSMCHPTTSKPYPAKTEYDQEERSNKGRWQVVRGYYLSPFFSFSFGKPSAVCEEGFSVDFRYVRHKPASYWKYPR